MCHKIFTIYVYFHRAENGCYLYGLFDGHDGVKAAHFAASRLPAELLLGQINPNYNPSDSAIQKVLYQSFSIVERGFFESIDTALAKKTYLQSQVSWCCGTLCHCNICLRICFAFYIQYLINK